METFKNLPIEEARARINKALKEDLLKELGKATAKLIAEKRNNNIWARLRKAGKVK